MKGYSVLVNTVIYATIFALLAAGLTYLANNPNAMMNTITGMAVVTERTVAEALNGNIVAAAALGAVIGALAYLIRETYRAAAVSLVIVVILAVVIIFV